MQLYLDDIRHAPPGWVQAYDYLGAIAALRTGKVTEISFDHDLGQGKGKSGYDVACWLEEAVNDNVVPMPSMSVHSDNPPGRKRIQACIDAIKRRVHAEEQRQFKEYLEEAAAIVASWPEWKQKVARQIMAPSHYWDNERLP